MTDLESTAGQAHREALAAAAERLDHLTRGLAEDAVEVRVFRATLLPTLLRVRSGELSGPVEWRDIPGGAAAIQDDALRRHPELESCFARFRLLLAGIALPQIDRPA